MKIKDGFLLREIADTYVVIPIAERVIEFKGMMTLNSISADVWKFLSEDRTYKETLDFIVESFEVDEKTADADLRELIERMETSGVLEQ